MTTDTGAHARGADRAADDGARGARTVKRIIALYAVIGAGLSAALYVGLRRTEEDRVAGQFEQASLARAAVIESEARNLATVLRALRGLFDASDRVERAEFRLCAEEFLRVEPGIAWLAWIRRVRPSEQGANEHDAPPLAAEGVPGTSAEPPSTELLFPLQYIQPRTLPPGLDLATLPDLRPSLESASLGRELFVAPDIPIAFEGASGPSYTGLLFLLPVRLDAAARASQLPAAPPADGLVALMCDPYECLRACFARLAPAAIAVWILEVDQSGGEHLIAHQSADPREPATATPIDLAAARAGLHWEQRLEFGGRRWSVLAAPAPAFFAQRRDWLAASALLLGLALTALTAGLAWRIAGEGQRVATVVSGRTAELASWKWRYDAAAAAEGQVLYDWDPESDVVVWGAMLTRTLGWRPDELERGGERWTLKIHPEDRPRARAELQRVLRSGDPFHLVYRMQQKNGAYVRVEDDARFVDLQHGHPAHMVGFLTVQRLERDEPKPAGTPTARVRAEP